MSDDPRVVLIHHTEPRGQRQSINEAAHIVKFTAGGTVWEAFGYIEAEL